MFHYLGSTVGPFSLSPMSGPILSTLCYFGNGGSALSFENGDILGIREIGLQCSGHRISVHTVIICNAEKM